MQKTCPTALDAACVRFTPPSGWLPLSFRCCSFPLMTQTALVYVGPILIKIGNLPLKRLSSSPFFLPPKLPRIFDFLLFTHPVGRLRWYPTRPSGWICLWVFYIAIFPPPRIVLSKFSLFQKAASLVFSLTRLSVRRSFRVLSKIDMSPPCVSASFEIRLLFFFAIRLFDACPFSGALYQGSPGIFSLEVSPCGGVDLLSRLLRVLERFRVQERLFLQPPRSNSQRSKFPFQSPGDYMAFRPFQNPLASRFHHYRSTSFATVRLPPPAAALLLFSIFYDVLRRTPRKGIRLKILACFVPDWR